MSAPPVMLDFGMRRRPVTVAGALLLVAGLGAVAAAAWTYQRLDSRRAGLELRLQSVTEHRHRDPAEERAGAALSAESGRVAYALGAPWTRLLAELEAASRDSADRIALLSIEPDPAKHLVRITGESRDLPLILAYVQRLQGVALLRDPTLESHEVKADDPQRPVRFAMTAEWAGLP